MLRGDLCRRNVRQTLVYVISVRRIRHATYGTGLPAPAGCHGHGSGRAAIRDACLTIRAMPDGTADARTPMRTRAAECVPHTVTVRDATPEDNASLLALDARSEERRVGKEGR